MIDPSHIPFPAATTFNWGNARSCLAWCNFIYGNAAAPVQPIAIKSPSTEALAWVVELPDCIVVAFRGSQVAKDYLQDAKFALIPLLPGFKSKAHKGFMEDYKSIREPILDALIKLPSKPIFATGHSLGGGQVILCAKDLANKGFKLQAVYTFGGPRSGNISFKRYYGSKLAAITWRVVNQNDIVPRVPGLPTTWFVPNTWPYRHVGIEVLLAEQGGYVYDAKWWQNGQSNVAGLWQAFKNHKEVLVNDHHIHSYMKRMSGLS